MILGAHESTAGGFYRAFEHVAEDRALAIQVFTRSSRAWRAPPISDADVEAWDAARRASGIAHVLCHDSYLINLAAEPGDVREKSLEAFTDELVRCGRLGIPWLVAHPGVHATEERGLRLVAEALDACFSAAKGAGTGVLLENTAGQGASLGWRFPQLARLLELTRSEARLGLCLDTCHAYAAGHDWTSASGYAALWREVDATVGLARLKAFHLNDSLKPAGCRVDRHEQIGKGCIGAEAFGWLVRDERFAAIPGVVELPEPKKNVARLRKLQGRLEKSSKSG